MKLISLFLSGVLLALISMASAAEEEAAPKWTYRREAGEDATSTFYYFFRSRDGSIEAVRSVWNGGAQNPPQVVDYLLEPGKIAIRHQSGKRDVIPALIEGDDAPLTVDKEYALTSRDSRAILAPPPPDQHLSDEQRIDLYNLICMLADERRRPFVAAAKDEEKPELKVAAAGQEGEIIVNVSPNGELTVEGVKLSPDELRAKLDAMIKAGKRDQAVRIVGQGETDFTKIVQAVAVCQEAQAWNISFGVAAKK